jgi:Flp pilus assembly protein TadG
MGAKRAIQRGTKMLKAFKKLWNDDRGNILVIAGATLPLVVGAAGLATDTIQWTLWKRQLQRAADSAAIAGVYERQSANGATSTVSATVSHDLTINDHAWMALKSGYPQVTFPADVGVQTNQVRVVIAVQQPLPFSSLFLPSAPTIVTSSTAATIPAGGDACIMALETSASATGITNSGNTTVTAPNCILYSNSPSTNSASAGGSSSVTAKAVAAVGGIAQSNNWNVGQYLPYSPALSDPFAGITPDPNAMNCTTTDISHNTDLAALKAAGYNCFPSLSVGSNKTLNVPADFGPIYINGGSVDLKGTFNCNGCTIVLTNKSTAANATIGTMSSNAQATNNITAPTSGTYKGIAIYQDRRATGQTNKINGGSSSPITGAVYLPKDVLWINGSGSTTSLCAMFVARRIVFTGNSSISLKNQSDTSCLATGMPSSSAVKMVRLVA